ncbi:nitronate monooxygenase [Mangrovihabitans endophyticus]|uniref:Propionate 3-nitronate monooxygenase n=1 Tax=Mangrovihabitans endophyticus TaxID=1751298 RepID=A0A8J3BVX1_9ACTN|nr:nitronate monooxygenase [Mangrovihabitans endophyticus]GGK74313.1 oxidoreductase [Mangrovihabitans endophyticus]
MLLDLDRRVVVAPMAGGPSTVDLVVAAARAGSVGFLAAGYKTPDAVAAELDEVQSAGVTCGLNLFVPQEAPADTGAVERYRRELEPEAKRLGVDLPAPRPHDDDAFGAKVELAAAHAPPLVSFTFGVPERAVVETLRRAGSTVLVTVTSADEADAAARAGADMLVAQGGTAGGHASTSAPGTYDGAADAPAVLRMVRAATALPVVAAGGVGAPDKVRELLAAGAVAVQCGTVFLLADEAGTGHAQRTAMHAGPDRETVLTRAYTGRPARALRNRFTDEHSATAPLAYPAIHHLTAPLRAAAARAGDLDVMSLWAGTAHRHARPGTVRQILDRLEG